MRARSRLKDELGYVLARRTDSAAISKVLDHMLAVIAHGSEVKRVPARVQGEDHVELLDEDGTRLMDGAHNGLSSSAEFLEEANNRIS